MKWTNPLEWLKLDEEDEDDGDMVENSVIEVHWEEEHTGWAAPILQLLALLPRR